MAEKTYVSGMMGSITNNNKYVPNNHIRRSPYGIWKFNLY